MSNSSPLRWFFLVLFLPLLFVTACTAVDDPPPTIPPTPTNTPTIQPTLQPTRQPTATSPATVLASPTPLAEPVERPLYYLGHLLDETTSDFVSSGGFVTYYIQDLHTGETLVRDPGVAVSGTSLVKIPILIEAYRTFDNAPNSYHTKLMTETIELSSNYGANLLLGFISGDEDPYHGTDALTTRLRELGLYNTFIAAPYDSIPREGRPVTFITPANSRLDITTNPDLNMQTTAEDLGQLLSWLYACSQGVQETPLAQINGELTSDGCTAVIDLLARNNLGSLLEAGVPEDVPVAHKHGWIGDTHGDAGLILAEDAPYVMVVLLHKPGWLEWGDSSPLIAEMSRLAYGHFTDPQSLYPADLIVAEPTAVVLANPLPDLPRAIVVGTQGIGLRLRQSPGGAEIAILPEGSIVVLLDEAPRDVNGTAWREVQASTGETGWVGADYLLTD